jgi:protein tyrosine/serine phosphatase
MRSYSRSNSYYFLAYLAVLFVLGLFVVQGLLSAKYTNAVPVSVRNFGKINDHYYRGAQPESEQFGELKKLGIKTVIDLRKDREEKASDWAREAGLEYVNIPLTTKTPATEQQTNDFLKLVNDPEKWPVFVHCKGGRHRTGEMTAIYRITHDGWNATQAYEEMKKYDFENTWFYPRVLKKHVFSYYEEFASQKASRSQAANSGAAPQQ